MSMCATAWSDRQRVAGSATKGTWLFSASGADPRVVAILVEAAKAKAWKSVPHLGRRRVRCRGDKRQFETAGIAVTVVEPPPTLQAERYGENDSAEHNPRPSSRNCGGRGPRRTSGSPAQPAPRRSRPA